MAKNSPGLSSSRWAHPTATPPRASTPARPAPAPTSSTPTSTSTSTTAAPRALAFARSQALHRFEQACGRLRWKFIDLENSYKRANDPGQWEFGTVDAERNFKVDFHEFYVWIEQAIVLLFKVFGTTVERDSINAATDQNMRIGGKSAAAHAYHHNVLKTLDDETHPLHATLGRGDVNQALWKAKELRNRWKDAAEGRETPPLKMYHLSWIVTEVMKGLEDAYQVASARVSEELAAAEVGVTDQQRRVAELDEWEWMVEPMDWEA
ncbi:hypothetical protein RJ55_04641 [Drechmeria coniospora]|nr:hypothetical protein RJ55_04641 [Drechmeria coniospora]